MLNLYETDWKNFRKQKRTIYFLDKNVVQLIQTLKRGKELKDSNQIKMKTRLEEIDKSENIVSLMLSIIEGRKGRKETSEEKNQAILEEINILKDFFKQAKTDIDFLEKNMEYVSEVLSGNHIELDEPLYLEYLQNFFGLWKSHEKKGAIPKHDRNKITNTLIEYANTKNIQLQHSVVLLTIGAVYGKKEAIQILKPNQSEPYNAYNDIASLTRLASHKARFSETHNCDFLTFDKGILSWFEIFKITEVSLTRNLMNGDRTKLEISINKNFLPPDVRKKLTKQ